jgi:glycine cleavage system H lipoate-binding protein
MEFMPTKGIEYLLVLLYLALLVPFWKLLAGRRVPGRILARAPGRSWFAVPEGFHYHPGHTWARPETDELLRVGMDDFAYRLVGPLDGIELPPVGRELTAGHPGWRVRVDGRSIPLLAPVSGRVEAVNEEILSHPETAAADPYKDSWLLKVAVPSASTTLRNLLPDRLARAWTEEASEELSSLMGRELGVVLADGGTPVFGLARELAGDGWPELTARLLLTREEESEPTDLSS